MLILIVALVIASYCDAALNEDMCGRPVQRIYSDFVVGGEEVNPDEWPWLVAIYRKNKYGTSLHCGGTLVDRNVVITAAHCINHEVSRPDKFVVYVKKFSSSTWGKYDESIAFMVKRIEMHPFYLSSVKQEGDLAIMFLTKDVEISNGVKTVCVLDNSTMEHQAVGTVIGWGRTNNETVALEPQKVSIKLQSRDTCVNENPLFAELITQNTFCAGDSKGRGPCSGDSGGGFYQKVKTDGGDNIWTIRGVVSRSANLSGRGLDDCLDNTYFVFTDVIKLLPWIRHQINDEIAEQDKDTKIVINGNEDNAAPCITEFFANDIIFSTLVERKHIALASYLYLAPVICNEENKTEENIQMMLKNEDAMFIVLEMCRTFKARMLSTTAEKIVESLPKLSAEEARKIFQHEDLYGKEALISLDAKCMKFNNDKIVINPLCPTFSLNLFKYFIRGVAFVNFEHDKQRNALHSAVWLNKLDIVRYLVQYTDIRVNDADHRGLTPLLIAATYDFCDIVKYLVTEAKAILSTNFFSAASINCSKCTMNFIMNYKHMGNIEWDKFPEHQEIALHCAAKCGNLDFVKFLVNLGFDVNVNRFKYIYLGTPLHVAAEYGHFQVVTYLINNASANASIRNRNRETALVYAVRKGYLDITKFLGNIARDNHDKDSIILALFEAARLKKLEFAKYLVTEAHSDVLVNARNEYKTVLDFAAEKKDIKIFKYLVEDVGIREINGESALHIAAKYNNIYIVRYLSRKLGMNIRGKNKLGETPLQVANKELWNTDVIRYLEKYGS